MTPFNEANKIAYYYFFFHFKQYIYKIQSIKIKTNKINEKENFKS